MREPVAGEWPARIAQCMADFGRHLAYTLGGKVFEWNDVVLCDPGMASAYRNLAVPLRPVLPPDQPALSSVLTDFYPADRKWVVWEAFQAELAATGLCVQGTNPTMWRRPGPLRTGAPPAGFTITPVRTDADVRTFERVRAASYRDAPRLTEPGQPDSRMVGNGFQLWLGWLGSEPVATGAAFSNGELNAVKHISTLSPFRGKRIGAAMTAHAVNSSALPSILDSDPDARRLYQRLGFRQAGQVRFWSTAG